MNWIQKALLTLFVTLALPTLQAEEASEKLPDQATISIALGHFLVRNLNTPAITYDVKKVIEGMQAEVEGRDPPLQEEELVQAISKLQAAHMETIATNNLKEAEIFLEKNASEKDIVSVSPKLQYKVLSSGCGESISNDSSPLVHFSCKLLDGTPISSTYEGEEPISLPLVDALSGIREGMIGMKQGEKRCLYIHPELGFGNASHLPPNSLLVFEVEVIEGHPVAVEAMEEDLSALDFACPDEIMEEEG